MIIHTSTLDAVIDTLVARHPEVDPAQVAACVYATYDALKNGATITTHLITLTQSRAHKELVKAAESAQGATDRTA
ncbi:three-helix bundle dimerization domain-containing protein [Nocardiopsis sp. M1B1]|uniref:three-helix bundle dimerization domain-containing protein n=1 Tax=Nocardiopsis sp. M1B1 TaxID=3450454 RepID=UPI00403A0A74